jgi:hypothetical protein
MGTRLAVVVLAGLLIGCEANQPPDDTPEYDPQIDAPPTNLVVQVDHNLLADQAELADEVARAVASAGTGARGATGGEEDATVTQVRGIMGKMIEAGKSGQLSAILEYFSDDDTDAMKDVVAALAELAKAKGELQKVANSMLGMKELPASLNQALGAGADGGPILASLGDLATDMLDYKTDGNTVTVTGAGTPLKLTKGEGDAAAWEIQLTDAEKQMYLVLAELARVQTAFATKLADGVRDAEITEGNLDKTAMDLMEERIKPALERLEEARKAAKGNGGDGGNP